jgi:branched-chain amino acid transport system substrate-binding protein
MGVKKVATIYTSEEAGTFAQAALEANAEKIGVKVVSKEMYVTGKTDFTTELAKMKASNPDALVLWTWMGDTGYIIKQAREMGITVPIGGVDLTPDAIEIGGDKLDGYIISKENFDPNLKDPYVQHFVSSYKKRFNGEMPDMYAANYYEIVNVERDLIKHVLSKNGDPWDVMQLKNAIAEVKYFDSLYGGKMEIKPDGSVTKPVCVFRSDKKGNLTVLKMIK